MTEAVNNFNTDLKDLFVNNKFEELTEQLEQKDSEIVKEIVFYNYGIVKKYYDDEKFDLLVQYVRFVAYSSFLCEYGAKKGMITSDEYNLMNQIFMDIHAYMKQKHN